MPDALKAHSIHSSKTLLYLAKIIQISFFQHINMYFLIIFINKFVNKYEKCD